MNKKKLSPDELAKKAITSNPLFVKDEPEVLGSFKNLKDKTIKTHKE